MISFMTHNVYEIQIRHIAVENVTISEIETRIGLYKEMLISRERYLPLKMSLQNTGNSFITQFVK